jgi:hypothetical protein
MGLGFLGVAVHDLGVTNRRVSGGRIRIERQRSLMFGDSLGHAIGADVDTAHHPVRPSIIGRERQRLDQRRFDRSEDSGGIVCHVACRDVQIYLCCTQQCVQITLIERQSALEETTRLRQIRSVPCYGKPGPEK